MPYYRDLEQIFSRSTATGSFAVDPTIINETNDDLPEDQSQSLDKELQDKEETKADDPTSTNDTTSTNETTSLSSISTRKRPLTEPLSTSSTSIPMSVRSHKRVKQSTAEQLSQILSLFKEEMEDQRQQRLELAQATVTAAPTPKQLALRRLQDKYREVFDLEMMIKAMKVVEAKHETFLALERTLQEAQLRNEIAN